MAPKSKLHFPGLLGTLGLANFQGSLALTEGDAKRTVIFHGGCPVNVLSVLQEETLGRILLQEGKITSDDYSRMLDQMVNTHRSAGQILVSMGLLKAHEVFAALEYQVHKKLLNCFKMTSFSMLLEEKEVPPGLVINRMDPSEVIFSGIYENYSAERLQLEFPIEDQTVFSANETSRDLPVIMDPLEEKIYRSVERQSRLAEIREATGDPETLHAALYALHSLYLVEATGITRPRLPRLRIPSMVKKPATKEPKPAQPARVTPVPAPKAQAPKAQVKPGRTETDELKASLSLAMDNIFKARGVSPKLAEKVLSMGQCDHFEILDVDRKASARQIRAAFYQLLETFKLQEAHEVYTSDKDKDLAARLLDRATVAYRVLSDQDARKAYVEALEENKTAERVIPPRILADVEAQKGELALGAKRYEEAKRLFRQAIDMYPVEPSYYHKLGLTGYLQALEQTPADRPLSDSIRTPFERALVINPSYAPPRFYLANISKRNGDLERALQELEETLRCHPGNKQAQAAIEQIKKQIEESQS